METIEYHKPFLDTAPIIYYLERHPTYFDIMKRFLLGSGGRFLVSSAITVEEYCVLPYRRRDFKLIDNFNQLILAAGIKIVCIDRAVAERASRIRADHPAFKPMDALQLASAVHENCDLFLTNDKQLRQFRDVRCITVDELGDAPPQ